MMKTKDAATEFLAAKRIAVTGVSHAPRGHGSNVVYSWLKDNGYEAFPVNPNTTDIDGDRTYPDLASIPGGVEAVVIATSPAHADTTMRQASELGITRVWMHRSIGGGSVSSSATAFGREHGITVIDGGCPLMFAPNADTGHKIMCRVFTWTGKVPRRV